MGGKERFDGVGIFIAEKLVDSVVSVGRHIEKSTDTEDGLRQWFQNVLVVSAPNLRKPEAEKESF